MNREILYRHLCIHDGLRDFSRLYIGQFSDHNKLKELIANQDIDSILQNYFFGEDISPLELHWTNDKGEVIESSTLKESLFFLRKLCEQSLLPNKSLEKWEFVAKLRVPSNFQIFWSLGIGLDHNDLCIPSYQFNERCKQITKNTKRSIEAIRKFGQENFSFIHKQKENPQLFWLNDILGISNLENLIASIGIEGVRLQLESEKVEAFLREYIFECIESPLEIRKQGKNQSYTENETVKKHLDILIELSKLGILPPKWNIIASLMTPLQLQTFWCLCTGLKEKDLGIDKHSFGVRISNIKKKSFDGYSTQDIIEFGLSNFDFEIIEATFDSQQETSKLEELTEIQIKIYQLLIDGVYIGEISKTLCITVTEVYKHIDFIVQLYNLADVNSKAYKSLSMNELIQQHHRDSTSQSQD